MPITIAVLAHGNKGDVESAIRDFTKAIELKPDDAEAHYNRGLAYDGKGDVESAIGDYTKATELKPDFAEAYNNRGIAHGKKRQV